jgi:hypothetical protein
VLVMSETRVSPFSTNPKQNFASPATNLIKPSLKNYVALTVRESVAFSPQLIRRLNHITQKELLIRGNQFQGIRAFQWQ